MSEIFIRTEHRTGRITLNRPDALNALSWAMALEIEKAVMAWERDPGIAQIMIDATGTRAFCAGGDIIEIYEEGKQGENKNANQFWRDEYRLNYLIANLSKPYIAIMDGIVMGGGVGISAHGSHRIVTERTIFAMPECAIGLNPDVGGTLILARMPGHFGEYCGLSGAGLSGADCMALGVATDFVKTDQLEEIKALIIKEGIGALESHPCEPSLLSASQAEIDRVFSGADLTEIHAACRGSELLDRAGVALARNAPLSMEIALYTIRQARRHDDLGLALVDEFRASSRALLEGEMLEGIRAAVIDKDRDPKWRYPNIEDVPPALIAKMKSPAEGGDVEL